MIKIYLLFWVVLTSVLFGCSTATPTQPVIVNATAYPGISITPLKTTESYPGPDSAPSLNPKIDPKSLNAPKDAPLPANGNASISGIIFSKYSSTILSNFEIYATVAQGPDKNWVPAVLAGPMPNIGDVKADTDQNGKFEINNLPPGNYFLIVRMPTTYEIVMNSINDEKPKLITLNPNQRLALGVSISP